MAMPCQVSVMNQQCGAAQPAPVCDVQIFCIDNTPCVVGDVLNDLRSDLIGELGAINQYSQHFLRWVDRCPEAAALFCDTMNDEKRHVAEFTRLIAKLDPVQGQLFAQLGCPFNF